MTNMVAVKIALHERLTRDLGADPDTERVQVYYNPPGKIEHEAIYLGQAQFEQALAGGSGPDGIARQETVTQNVHVYVRRRGDRDTMRADQRAAEIGEKLERMLARNPSLEGVPGVMFAGIASGELDGGEDDDGHLSVLAYVVRYRSMLR